MLGGKGGYVGLRIGDDRGGLHGLSPPKARQSPPFLVCGIEASPLALMLPPPPKNLYKTPG